MALVLWDKDGTLLIKYLTKGGSINAEYYMSLLDELKKKKKFWTTNAVGSFAEVSCFCKTMLPCTQHTKFS